MLSLMFSCGTRKSTRERERLGRRLWTERMNENNGCIFALEWRLLLFINIYDAIEKTRLRLSRSVIRVYVPHWLVHSRGADRGRMRLAICGNSVQSLYLQPLADGRLWRDLSWRFSPEGGRAAGGRLNNKKNPTYSNSGGGWNSLVLKIYSCPSQFVPSPLLVTEPAGPGLGLHWHHSSVRLVILVNCANVYC